jgi:hypothetical protein
VQQDLALPVQQEQPVVLAVPVIQAQQASQVRLVKLVRKVTPVRQALLVMHLEFII